MPPPSEKKPSPKKKKSAGGAKKDSPKKPKAKPSTESEKKPRSKKATKPTSEKKKKIPKEVPEAAVPGGDSTAHDPQQQSVVAPPLDPPQSQVAAYLRQQKSMRKSHDLDKDPRTDLPLISPPPKYTQIFASVVGDKEPILLHNFEEVEVNHGEGLPPTQAIMMLTDQTLYLCDPNTAEVSRAMQIDQIQGVHMAPDGGNRIAIVGPRTETEYDMYLSFLRGDGVLAKTNVMKTLYLVYKRMTGGTTLPQQTSLGPPADYRLNRPPDYKIFLSPQRTKQHLRKTLENFDKQEDEILRWVEELQSELEDEHRERLRVKDEQIHSILSQLEEAEDTKNFQNQEIARLQAMYGVALEQDGEADPSFADLDPKDRRIMELESALKDIKIKADEEDDRHRHLDMAGNFFERDLSHEVKRDPTRPRGGSLHIQGLVEVLQKQVRERNRDVDDLQGQLKEIDHLKRQLRDKDATIAALNNQAEAAGGVGVSDTEPYPAEYSRYAAPGPSEHHHQHQDYPYIPQPDQPYDPYSGVGNGSHVGSGGGGPYLNNVMEDQPELPPFKRKEYIPLNGTEELLEHPITGLPLVNTPPELAKAFSDLQGATIHMFQAVNQVEKNGKKVPKVVIITDRCIYICDKKGVISKCDTIEDMAEIITDDGYGLGVRLNPSANDRDILLEMPTKALRDEAVNIFMTVQKHDKGNARRTQVQQLQPGHMNFKKPPSYELKLRALTSKQALHKLRNHNDTQRRQQHEAEQDRLQHEHEQSRRAYASEAAHVNEIQASQDAYTRHALEGLKHELRTELTAKKDAEYQRLKAQIKALEQENQNKANELENVKDQWKEHRCHREAPRPNIPNKHTEGMYWIPTEPVVLECQLQVLQVQFWDNILITSHANGFLNVWDIDTSECIRTLKDHTAKVIAFQYDGVELVSGSFDSTIRRWNVSDGSCLNVVAAHKGQVTCLQFDKNILISGSSDTTIQVWQMDIELRNIKTLRGHKAAVQALRFERDVLVSAEWGWLFVWDLTTGFVIKALRDEQGGITCLDYNNVFMVTGGHAGALTMWDVSTGDYETLYGHTDDITHIQIEGPYAVTSSADCTIRMWDLQNFKSLGVFNNSYPHESTTFQFIANRFVAVEDKTVKIWTK